MAEKPTCRHCGKPHWRFDRCAASVEHEAAQARRRANLRVVPEWRTDSDRELCDDLPSYQHQSGTNVFWRRRSEDGPEAA